MKFLTLITLVLGLIGPIHAQHYSQPVEPKSRAEKALRVEILVFSGRPNPVFLIDEKEVIEELVAEAKKQPKHPKLGAPSDEVFANRLGYRGIAVDNVSDVLPEIESIGVCGDDLEIHEKDKDSGKSKKRFALGGREFQRRLLELAVKEKSITQDLKDAILSGEF